MWVIAGPGALGRLAELRVKSAPARPSPWWLRAPASQQFSNVASALITPTQWIALSRQIGQVLKERDDIAGVVVTHGTDRLEETAFFLYLTVRSDKPASPSAVGKGVLVVMDGRILSAREVRKAYQRVGGFTTGDMGMLGVMGHDGAEFFFAPARAQGSSSEFDLSGIESLPDVDLLFSYPGGRGPRHDQRPAGIVVANTSFNCEETLAYLKLARAGTIVVSAFPSGDNVGRNWPPADSVPEHEIEPCTNIDRQAWEGRWIPPIMALHLTPQKARILLMLALTRSKSRSSSRRGGPGTPRSLPWLKVRTAPRD